MPKIRALYETTYFTGLRNRIDDAKTAKKGMPAPGSKVRATFIKIGELPSTATH